MKLQRSTGILLGVAISVVATVTLLEYQKSKNIQTSDTLYDFAEADVSALTLELENSTLSFKSRDETWYMDEPKSGLADPSAIAFLLNMLTSSEIKETITTVSESLEIYGLDEPKTIVKLTTTDTRNYTMRVGNADFSDTALYVITTEDMTTTTQPVNVHLIAKELENGLERPVADWLIADENN